MVQGDHDEEPSRMYIHRGFAMSRPHPSWSDGHATLSLTRERERGIPEKIIPFRFSKEALQTYLAAYREAGCPLVSHSETYRRAYRPAYRVVLQRHPCHSGAGT